MSVAILPNLYLSVLPLARPIYTCWNSPRRVAAQHLQHKWIRWQRLRARSRMLLLRSTMLSVEREPLRRRVLCSSSPVQLCSPSAGGTKMDPVQSIPFCFTCKHHNPIRNAPEPLFDNRMASMQMRLIDCLADRQRKQKIW